MKQQQQHPQPNASSPSTRTFLINQPQSTSFPKNVIKTATYNIYNFLPLALLNQFRSYFNIFFLICAILFSIPSITPVAPETSYAAFVVVQVISLLRTGIENYKKYLYDSSYNNSQSQVYDINNKQFTFKAWKHIVLGEIVKVEKDKEIPADLLIIKSSNDNGYCYLQTSNLDGETNLKAREALQCFHNVINTVTDCEMYGKIEIGKPDKNIYNIEGCVSDVDRYINSKIYFDISNCLLRGGVLKNVNYIYGIVIYTGKDTKIMMNINKGYQKLSNIDKLLNFIVLYLVIISLILAIIMAVIGIHKTSTYRNTMYYALYKTEDSGDRVLEGVRTSLSFFNIFASLIPISIMIVLEVVKTLQTVLLSFEEGYAVGDEKSKFLSLKLHENLGNIKYIFTDKTGTLTKNEMEFKGCSIFTRLYAQNENNITLYDTAIDTTTITKQRTIFSKDFNVQRLKESLLNDEYLEINSESKECYYKSLNEVTLDFFVNIALNHNVLVNVNSDNNDNSGEISKSMYSGSNPDETVLVQAAKELEVEFVERIGNDITIRIGGKCLVHYEMLYRFDFTSERKRSSIIVRCPDGVIKLFMKGADNVILQKINHFSKMNLFTKTCEHIDKFAKEGLRTLCYSVKVLTENEFKEFELQYQQLQAQCLVNKDKVNDVEMLISELESNMLLLGVTALEDMLQDNVKGAIKEFIEANINVWMLTGDKLDTAESIGYSCRLLMEDTEVFKIRDKDINNIEQVLKDIKQEIDDGLLSSAKMLNGGVSVHKDKDKGKEDIEGNNVNNRINSETKILHECNINNNNNNVHLSNVNNNNNNNKYTFKRKSSRSNSYKLKNKLAFRNKLFTHIPPQQQQQHISNNNYNNNYRLKHSQLFNTNNNNNNVIADSQILVYIPPKQIETETITSDNDISSTHKIITPSNNNNNNNTNTISRNPSQNLNTIPNSISNFQKSDPNDNSIFAYMIKGDFFLDNSIKDVSISFFNELKTQHHHHSSNQPPSPIDLITIKQKYKKQLDNINTTNHPLSKSPEKRNIQFSNYSLIIEGGALTECLKSHNNIIFYDILSKCRSVICSRCAPIQKSQVVEFIKKHSHQMTLAIGDGGNDVNMILSADVGVGIFGKEGSQAAYSSDYAFSQFHYLRKLLFEHGRYSIWRNAYFVHFYFFKNVVFVCIQLWFTFYSFISGTIYFDNFYIMGLNSFLTTAPPCVFALFEEDIDITFKHTKQRELAKMLIPQLYKSMRDNNPFSLKHFFTMFFAGVVISLFNFFIPLFAYRFTPTNEDGEMGTLLDMSLVSLWGMIISTYIVLITDTYYYNVSSCALHGLQVFVLIVFPIVHNTFEHYLISGRMVDIISTNKFWLVLIVSVYGNYLLFYIARTFQRFIPGNIVSRVRMNDIANDIKQISCLKKYIEAQKYERCVHKFKKVYKKRFMENESENYVDKKIREFVEQFKTNRLLKEERTLFKQVKEHSQRNNNTLKKLTNKQKSNQY